MKRYKSYIKTAMCMAIALAFTACSDEYMNDMNTDPSKAENIDPNSQLTFSLWDVGIQQTTEVSTKLTITK